MHIILSIYVLVEANSALWKHLGCWLVVLFPLKPKKKMNIELEHYSFIRTPPMVFGHRSPMLDQESVCTLCMQPNNLVFWDHV